MLESQKKKKKKKKIRAHEKSFWNQNSVNYEEVKLDL